MGRCRAHVSTVPDLSFDSLSDFRAVVAENQRAEPDKVVDQLVAIHVPLHRPVAPAYVKGVGIHHPRLGGAARNDLPASRVKLGGLLVGLIETLENRWHVLASQVVVRRGLYYKIGCGTDCGVACLAFGGCHGCVRLSRQSLVHYDSSRVCMFASAVDDLFKLEMSYVQLN